jgi:hypothetical protein
MSTGGSWAVSVWRPGDRSIAVPCCDRANRRRKAFVALTSAGLITITAPPGEAVMLTAGEAEALALALHECLAAKATPVCAEEITEDGLLRCADGIGRARSVGVFKDRTNRLMFVAPATGVAVLAPAQVIAVRDTLSSVVGELRAAVNSRNTEPEAIQPASSSERHVHTDRTVGI